MLFTRNAYFFLLGVLVCSSVFGAQPLPESQRLNSPELVRPLWTYPALSTGVGLSGILAGITTTGESEIYVGGTPGPSSGGRNQYWAALALNEDKEYNPVFASEFYPSEISRLALGDVTGNTDQEILVSLRSGIVHLYDQTSKEWLGTFATTATLSGDLIDMKVANLDGAGKSEVVISNGTSFAVYQDGLLSWSFAGAGGGLAIAQMDSDPQFEIATGSGKVIDSVDRAVQWDRGQAFGWVLRAGDIDGDGLDELVALVAGLAAYDVDLKTQKWSYNDPHGISSFEVADADGNESPEVIVGQDQSGDIVCLNAQGLVDGWEVSNPGRAVIAIAVADTDKDGSDEVIWGTTPSASAGTSALYVANPLTDVVEWKNYPIIGPFVGPQKGDLDGDGVDEVVVAATQPGIMVFDAITLRLRTMLSETIDSNSMPSIRDIKLFDVDEDGDKEIIVCGQRYNGIVQVYDFSVSNTLSLKWANTISPNSTDFTCVDAQDIDNDGNLEIVVGSRKTSTGGEGRFIFVYDYNTGLQEWQSDPSSWNTSKLVIGQIDDDPAKEIVANTSGGTHVIDGATKAVQLIFGYRAGLDIYSGAIYNADAEGWLWRSVSTGSTFSSIRVAPLGQGYPDDVDVLSSAPLTVKFAYQGKIQLYVNNATVSQSPEFGYGSVWEDGITAGRFSIASDYLPAPELWVEAVEDSGEHAFTYWSLVTGDVDYQVEMALDAAFTTPSSSGWIRTRSFTYSDIVAGRTHYFRVKSRLVDGNVESPWSRVATLLPGDAPAAVSDWNLYD